MTTDLLVIVVFGACLCGWVLLSIVGAERQRMIDQAEAARPPGPLPAPKLAAGLSPSAPRPRTDAPSKAPAPAKRNPAAAANAR